MIWKLHNQNFSCSTHNNANKFILSHYLNYLGSNPRFQETLRKVKMYNCRWTHQGVQMTVGIVPLSQLVMGLFSAAQEKPLPNWQNLIWLAF